MSRNETVSLRHNWWPSRTQVCYYDVVRGFTLLDSSSHAAERASQIAEMESMGFERSQIDAAMRAAFYNSERAIEYLLNVSIF